MTLELTEEEAKLLVHVLAAGIPHASWLNSEEKTEVRALIKRLKEASDDSDEADGTGGPASD